MRTKYGKFSHASTEDYRKKLHKKLFWLLLYKDPNTEESYKNIDYDQYFQTLMLELKGLESMILTSPGDLVELMTMLEAAHNETLKPKFNYGTYRKFVLDAHSVLDRLNFDVKKKRKYDRS